MFFVVRNENKAEKQMYKVEAETLTDYFEADALRKSDLKAMDALLRRVAPGLQRWFYPGVQTGEAGMQMKMIGYGTTVYQGKGGKVGKWPIVGLALQKNYISLYIAADKNGLPVLDSYCGQLGETRSGQNNFSFVRFAQLDSARLEALLQDIVEATSGEQGAATSPPLIV